MDNYMYTFHSLENQIKLIMNGKNYDFTIYKPYYEKSAIVQIIAGPFEKFTGKIEEVNVEKEKLKVLISIFGKTTPIEVDFQQVEQII